MRLNQFNFGNWDNQNWQPRLQMHHESDCFQIDFLERGESESGDTCSIFEGVPVTLVFLEFLGLVLVLLQCSKTGFDFKTLNTLFRHSNPNKFFRCSLH
jgi:hypothetical protein